GGGGPRGRGGTDGRGRPRNRTGDQFPDAGADSGGAAGGGDEQPSAAQRGGTARARGGADLPRALRRGSEDIPLLPAASGAEPVPRALHLPGGAADGRGAAANGGGA